MRCSVPDAVGVAVVSSRSWLTVPPRRPRRRSRAAPGLVVVGVEEATRTVWFGPTSISGGLRSSQTPGMHCGQRVENGQPRWTANGLGTLPAIGTSSSSVPSMRGIERHNAWV